MNPNDINQRFAAQTSADPEIAAVLHALAEAALLCARTVDAVCTDGRQKSLALTKLEEAMLWACSSIRHDGVAADADENLADLVVAMDQRLAAMADTAEDISGEPGPTRTLSDLTVPPAFRPAEVTEEEAEIPHIPDLLVDDGTDQGALVPAPEAESERIITRRVIDVKDLPENAAGLLRKDNLRPESY